MSKEPEVEIVNVLYLLKIWYLIAYLIVRT